MRFRNNDGCRERGGRDFFARGGREWHGGERLGDGHFADGHEGDSHDDRHARLREMLMERWAGRHGHGHGGHGRGGRGFGPFGGFGGGPGGMGFRSGRKLSSADLQLILLALIGEKPRHGYDLIKALEERSKGFYVPSPGVIYPALTYLEEAGDAKAEADGARKLYQLTEAGQARLAAQRAEVDAMLAQLAEMGRGMDRMREAFSGEGTGDDEDRFAPFRRAWGASAEMKEAMHELRAAISEQRGKGSRERWQHIAAALRRAAEEIRKGAAGAE
ncbi:MAG: PadR family transcriptional regulator [Solimonas sp.]